MPPPPLAAASSGPYEDRKTGLVLFGVMTMLIGGVCALFVPLAFFGQAMAPKTSPPQDPRAIASVILIYGLLAVVFVWLGIGSMMARRWARALLLVLSWCWLVIGLLSVIFMAIGLPKILEAVSSSAPPGQPAPPAGAMAAVMGVTMVFMVIIFVIIPAVWVFFYQSRNVKATCEAEDPVERWTDRCPLPVIAVCLWLGFSAPMMILMGFAYKGVVPAFGTFVVGPLGTVIYLLIGVLWGYSAWALYKLKPIGWWMVTVSVTMFCVSGFLTYSQHDVSELYTLMGYPAEQIAQIQKFSFLQGMGMAWMTLGGVVPMLGYMLFLRRYLVHSEPA